MENPSELVNFLNDLSLSGLEGLAEKNCEEIASKLKPLQESFRNHIEELRRKSVGNNTRMHLLDSTDDVEFVMKGIIDESSLKTQTEYINHWISKLKLCQNTITVLVNYLKKRCDHYKLHWENYIEKDISNVRDARYLFLTVHKTYSQIYGLCQNLAIAICDYFNLYGKIQINIGKKKKILESHLSQIQRSQFLIE
jgi:hypothetical protein